jgi:hypothetical protein
MEDDWEEHCKEVEQEMNNKWDDEWGTIDIS